jgi:biopolymer transport protein ExbD
MVQKGVDVKLPETTQDTAATPQGLIVMTLRHDMKVDINRTIIEWAQVGEWLRQEYATRQDKTIFLRADSKIPYARIIELIDIARGAGVETTGLIPEIFTEEDIR